MGQDDVFLYIIGYAIAFIIGILATFSIPKLIKLQEAQLEVLVEIAKQQGVKGEVLSAIHTSKNLTVRAKTNEEIRKDLEKQKTPTDQALENEALSYPKEK